ncbi:acyl-CoA dehydrogenase, partial [Alphaproteobacteria bacterium]|nr:acyl-CoA dehydrogenase [Alphaproteobacteria bacterium]
SASEATRISHQVHGAIGFTQDYILQSFTRQIWGWRSRFGSEAFWADQLGDITTSQNGNDFWSFMVGRDQG